MGLGLVRPDGGSVLMRCGWVGLGLVRMGFRANEVRLDARMGLGFVWMGVPC